MVEKRREQFTHFGNQNNNKSIVSNNAHTGRLSQSGGHILVHESHSPRQPSGTYLGTCVGCSLCSGHMDMWRPHQTSMYEASSVLYFSASYDSDLWAVNEPLRHLIMTEYGRCFSKYRPDTVFVGAQLVLLVCRQVWAQKEVVGRSGQSTVWALSSKSGRDGMFVCVCVCDCVTSHQ